MPTKMDRIFEEISKVRVDIGKVQQHLADMNGRLAKHDRFLMEDCPKLRQEYMVQQAKNSVRLVLICSLLAALGAGIASHVIPRMFS